MNVSVRLESRNIEEISESTGQVQNNELGRRKCQNHDAQSKFLRVCSVKITEAYGIDIYSDRSGSIPRSCMQVMKLRNRIRLDSGVRA